MLLVLNFSFTTSKKLRNIRESKLNDNMVFILVDARALNLYLASLVYLDLFI